MAEKIISPGVFTRENDLSFLPQGVGEIGAAIVGPTVKGPVGIPTEVTSYAEYVEVFGNTFKSGSDYYQYLTSHTAEQYLQNGGPLTVVRVAGSGFSHASSSVSALKAATAGTFGTASLTIKGLMLGDEIGIGDVDFTFVTGSGNFTNTATQVFVESGSTNTLSATNLKNAINSTVSTTGLNIAATQDGTPDADVHLSSSIPGAAGNLALTSASVVPTIAGTFFGYSATGPSSTTMVGGTDGDAQVAFNLRTLSDGALLNNTHASENPNGVLPSGSKDNIRWEIASVDKNSGTFNLVIRRGNDSGIAKIPLETFSNLSLDPNTTNYIAKVIGDQQNTIGGTESDPYVQLSGSYQNFSRYVRVEVLKQTVDYLDENGNIRGDAATQAALSGSLPVVGSGSFDGGADGNVKAGAAKFYETIDASNSQGFDLSSTSNDDGGKSYLQALNLLANQDEYDINMILVPGANQRDHSPIVDKAIRVAESRGDAFTIVDPVPYGSTPETAVAEAADYNSSYAAMYWPWVQIPDNQLNKLVWVPAGTVLPGVLAFNDRVAHEWYAPAGLNRGGIDVAVRAERKLTHTNRDTLYEGRVNPLATFPGQGVCVWGQKTLQKKSSALDRVNVRRLLINLKKFIASTSRFLVFENNTNETRNRFLSTVVPYMERVQQNQGLFAFKVVMDGTNNTPDIVDRNIMKGDIFIQPAKAAEFIVIDFNVMPTGATFGE